ncbi:UNVERIFIED_CONTAM: hypothetical protein FKN15_005750 [Acipenser sinensis]
MAAKGPPARKEKFIPRNKKNVTPAEMKKMAPQLKAQYRAYEDPSKDVLNLVMNTQQRLRQHATKEHQDLYMKTADPKADVALGKQEKLIGQLKAAEARNRIRIMRLRYQSMRAQEINHLIACQSTAQKSVRLELLLPPRLDTDNPGDSLDKMEASIQSGQKHSATHHFATQELFNVVLDDMR